MKNENIKLVNNTGTNVSMYDKVLLESVESGILPEEFSDIFTLEILQNYNPDGSNRGILNFAV